MMPIFYLLFTCSLHHLDTIKTTFLAHLSHCPVLSVMQVAKFLAGFVSKSVLSFVVFGDQKYETCLALRYAIITRNHLVQFLKDFDVLRDLSVKFNLLCF